MLTRAKTDKFIKPNTLRRQVADTAALVYCTPTPIRYGLSSIGAVVTSERR